MNIALIYPCSDEQKTDRFGYSLLLLRLGSLLKESGHQARYFDLSIENGEIIDEITKWANSFIVELDAFTLRRATNIHHGEKLIGDLRAFQPNAIITAVGRDLTLFPREISGATFSVCGCPFEIILDLITLDKQTSYSAGLINTVAQPFRNLPSPDYDLIKWDFGSIQRRWGWAIERSALLETSRGCLGNCRFCQRKAWAPKAEIRDLTSIRYELLMLERLQIRNIWICDDNLGFSNDHAKAVFELIVKLDLGKTFRIALSSWAKLDTNLLDLAAAAGVKIISIGIESANTNILKFYGKPCTKEEVRNLVEKADQKGIFTVGNFILGAPQESVETFEESLQFGLSIPLDQINVKNLSYMAGSELYASLPLHLRNNQRTIFACQENGLCLLTRVQIKKLAIEFQNRFYSQQSNRIQNKISRFGPPFDLKKPEC